MARSGLSDNKRQEIQSWVISAVAWASDHGEKGVDEEGPGGRRGADACS